VKNFCSGVGAFSCYASSCYDTVFQRIRNSRRRPGNLVWRIVHLLSDMLRYRLLHRVLTFLVAVGGVECRFFVVRICRSARVGSKHEYQAWVFTARHGNLSELLYISHSALQECRRFLHFWSLRQCPFHGREKRAFIAHEVSIRR